MEKKEIFSKELIDVLEEKRNNRKKNINSYFDIAGKNENPLKEIPKPKMRLYVFSEFMFKKYFDTEKELIESIKKLDSILIGDVQMIEYLGEVAGCKDVIRKTYPSGREELLTVIDEDGYGIYNEKQSICSGEFVWEFEYGNLREDYKAFRDRGIIFSDDIYAKVDQKYEESLKYFTKIYKRKK